MPRGHKHWLARLRVDFGKLVNVKPTIVSLVVSADGKQLVYLIPVLQ